MTAPAPTSRPQLVLASASPRRRALLGTLGLSFVVRPVDLDETPRPSEPPAIYVERLAREKARAAVAAGELVLAADTTVVLDGRLLGKPESPADAEAMLAGLAGREHTVLTGVALHEGGSGREIAAVESTQVRIASLSREEIAWYVGTREPLDKAGSYGIQGAGALFVEAVTGNYTNVAGLPLPLVRRLCRELGYDVLSFR